MGDFLRPTRQYLGIVLKPVFVGNANVFLVAAFEGVDGELMQMVVEPTEGIRYGAMQIPEGVAVGHLNTPPNEWFNILQGDLELEDLLERLAALAVLALG